MRGQYGKFYFDEPTNAIRYCLVEGWDGIVYDCNASIPFADREHADRIIEHLNIALRGEA